MIIWVDEIVSFLILGEAPRQQLSVLEVYHYAVGLVKFRVVYITHKLTSNLHVQ